MKGLTFFGLILSMFFIVDTITAQVSIVEEGAIMTMVQRDKEINKNTTAIKGWSVQLMATDQRSKVMTKKGEFLSKYPRIKVDWDYENPYYKLRAGAYHTKIEAARLLYLIRQDYPDAYIIQSTKLSPRDFL